jgi:hypothetical protein
MSRHDGRRRHVLDLADLKANPLRVQDLRSLRELSCQLLAARADALARSGSGSVLRPAWPSRSLSNVLEERPTLDDIHPLVATGTGACEMHIRLRSCIACDDGVQTVAIGTIAGDVSTKG